MNTFDRDDWWDRESFPYGLHELLNPVRIPYIDGHFRKHRVDSVLDVGCGGGYVAEELAKSGYTVTGIDVSSKAIASAVHNRSTDHPWYAVADAHELPFADGTFDGVVLSEVLEHVARPRVALSEAARVLADGGVLVATGPNRTLLSRLALIWLAQDSPLAVVPKDLHSYRAFLRPAEIAHWSKKLGLDHYDTTGIGTRIRDLPRTTVVALSLRRGNLTYGEAGRRLRLRTIHSRRLAFMMAARKR